jgi:hypothetical protein
MIPEVLGMLENRYWAVDCFSVSEGRAAGKISKTESLWGFLCSVTMVVL